MRRIPRIRVYGMEQITGKNNDRVKDAAKLVRSAAYRRETGRFVTEGVRLCLDALTTGLAPLAAFVTRDRLDRSEKELAPLLDSAGRAFLIGGDAAAKLSDTQGDQGIFCVWQMLDKSGETDTIKDSGRYIALENIQNPDNLGACLRTAEALGLDGAIVSGGCDLYNPKTLRASMGSALRLPVTRVDSMTETVPALRDRDFRVYACVVSGYDMTVLEMDRTAGLVCVIGNEGNGLTPQTAAACTGRLTIPMRGWAESLNAAQAAALVMWEMMR